jgi:23S rRNA (uracil1939-C5)-methyltransferase
MKTHRGRPARRPAAMPERPRVEAILTVEKLGTEGMGFARHEGRPVLLPDILPGERVRAVLAGKDATVLERLVDSPDRITPACRHAGRCGGCLLQHLAETPYRDFKRGLIADALGRQGLGAVPVLPVLASPPGSRRRATLEARRQGRQVTLGFHERAGHRIVDLAECSVLRPELVALAAPLRDLLGRMLQDREQASLSLTALDAGIDLGLALPRIPDLEAFERLAGFAADHDLARLWWRAEAMAPVPAAERRIPLVSFGGVPVALPMGGFLQATAEGEAALTQAVLAAVGEAKQVADLHAGSGTFTLPLAAAGARVHAVEWDATALGALASASGRAGLVQVTTERRDLEERPLGSAELKSYDAVVFDPPRAGAKRQAEALAQSAVPVIVGVSCNPASFARDAAILTGAGWRLDSVQPVDQFVWSNHIELVGVFKR